MNEKVYLTERQIIEKYKISRMTLWVWRRIGILKPYFFDYYQYGGGKKAKIHYLENDVIEILKKKKRI